MVSEVQLRGTALPHKGPAAPRILIVRAGAMGDVAHALPAIAMLRARLPGAWIGWAVAPQWAAMLRSEGAVDGVRGAADGIRGAAMPLVDCVHLVETRLWSRRPVSGETLRSVLALRRSLRGERYDLAIDLQGSVRSAVIARMSGARVVAGGAAPREWPARLLYGARIPVRGAHVIEHAAEVVRGALAAASGGSGDRGAGFSGRGMDEAFALSAASREAVLVPLHMEAERWCDALLAGDARGVVLLVPQAGWGAKEWPAERYGAVAAALAARGFRVLVNAAPPLPDAVAFRVRRAAGPGAVAVVESSIAQLTALLRRVSLVIAGDTGPLHLAAALGVPVVGLFGPTDPARNGPFSARAVVLRDPGSVTDHRRHAATEAGLLRIGVESVVEAARSLLLRASQRTRESPENGAADIGRRRLFSPDGAADDVR